MTSAVSAARPAPNRYNNLYVRVRHQSELAYAATLVSKPLLLGDSAERELARVNASMFAADPDQDMNAIGSHRLGDVVDKLMILINHYIARMIDIGHQPDVDDTTMRLTMSALCDAICDEPLEDNMNYVDDLFTSLVVRMARIFHRFSLEHIAPLQRARFFDVSPHFDAALDDEYEANPSLGSSTSLGRDPWFMVYALMEYGRRLKFVIDPMDNSNLTFEEVLRVLVRVDVCINEVPFVTSDPTYEADPDDTNYNVEDVVGSQNTTDDEDSDASPTLRNINPTKPTNE